MTAPTADEMREAWEEMRRVEGALQDLGIETAGRRPSEALREVNDRIARVEAQVGRAEQVAKEIAALNRRIEKAEALAAKEPRDGPGWLGVLVGMVAGLFIGLLLHLATLRPGGGP